jgi:hypothetical protein
MATAQPDIDQPELEDESDELAQSCADALVE